MVLSQTKTEGSPRNRRGQGTVEVIVALPVFLLLICILFQLFLVAIALVQLRYAAFCAARVGAVRNADIKEMTDAVGKVISGTPGLIMTRASSYRIEKLDLLNEANVKRRQALKQPAKLLKIRVYWDYPLSVPLVDALWSVITKTRIPFKKLTVPLQASWTTVKFEGLAEKVDEME